LKLARAIGLYCSTESASRVLGIKTIALELKLGKSQLLTKKYWTTLITSCFTMDQYVWKMKPPKPSGPRALSPLRAKTAFLISSTDGIKVKRELICSSTKTGMTSSTRVLSCKTEKLVETNFYSNWKYVHKFALGQLALYHHFSHFNFYLFNLWFDIYKLNTHLIYVLSNVLRTLSHFY